MKEWWEVVLSDEEYDSITSKDTYRHELRTLATESLELLKKSTLYT